MVGWFVLVEGALTIHPCSAGPDTDDRTVARLPSCARCYNRYNNRIVGLAFYPDQPDLLSPTAPCSCGSEHVRHIDSASKTAAGVWLRQACCEKCYAHWWVDESLRYVEHPEPFRPYTFVLAATGQIPPPPNHVVVPGNLKGLTRFNYWKNHWINSGILAPHTFPGDHEFPRVLEQVHSDDDSVVYRLKHETGDTTAIFEFVRACTDALEYGWVRKQLTAWRRANTRESIENYRRLANEGIDGRGRGVDRLLELRDDIERDQRIFRRLCEARQRDEKLESVIAELSASTGLSGRAIRDVEREYGEYAKSLPTLSHENFIQHLATLVDRLPRQTKNPV